MKKNSLLYGIIPVVFIAIFVFLLSPVCGNEWYTVAYAEAEDPYEVYLGGFPIGISAESDKMVVEELVNVTTEAGSFCPALRAGIQKGDVIVTVNGKKITTTQELLQEVESSDLVVVSVKRGNRLIDIPIVPTFDRAENAKKIGIVVKNDLVGMGTMTFVTKEGVFAALGHNIGDEFGNTALYQKGTILDAYVTGYTIAEKNVPGELRGKVFFDKPIGKIESNAFCGIFGEYTAVFPQKTVKIAPRGEVKTGYAQILSTISGRAPKLYDIEIIKAEAQERPAEKSLVIRVKDKELRETTGGILQGMSGSPILQNGKLVGAVTHVFNADSTKGYGVYAEWMLGECEKLA